MRAFDVVPDGCNRDRRNRTGGDLTALPPSPIVSHEEIERIVKALRAAVAPAR